MMFLGMIIPAGVVWHLTDGGFNLTQHAGRAWKMFRAGPDRPGERCLFSTDNSR